MVTLAGGGVFLGAALPSSKGSSAAYSIRRSTLPGTTVVRVGRGEKKSKSSLVGGPAITTDGSNNNQAYFMGHR